MKEAAGEANMTVITIILIGVIVAVATPLITNMMKTSSQRSCCTNNGGQWTNNACKGASATC
ncbi:MAG: hypothetical protein PHN72_02430 [Bacilli bacterium]|nr:hypothetical protein [Bacilli bacterium]